MADHVALTKPVGSKSLVWECFGIPIYESENGLRNTDKTKVICKLCNLQMKYNGNTTNMQKHLDRHHPSHLPSLRNSNPTCSSDTDSEKDTRQTVSAQSSLSGQLRLTQFKSSKYPFDSPRAKSLNRKVGIFIAKDLRPLSMVDNKHFREFVAELDPRYSMPSRKHFSEKIIPNLYLEAKEKIISELQETESVSLTTDSWTSRACESYVTITVHFMKHDWNMKSYVLQTRHLDVSHTGVNIGHVLQEAVTEWKLPIDNEIVLVTDNASNMDIAAKTADLHPHIGCFAYTVNLACQRGLKVSALGRLLGRIRKVVSFFHRSSTATAVLKSKQQQLSLPVHRLVQDVQTRWNSSYEMIQRYLEQEPAIHAALSSQEVKNNIRDVVTMSCDDLTDAEHIMKVLEPLKTVTSIMCAEHTPTVSLIYPMKAVILENMAENVHDSNLVRDVKQAIRDDLTKRYTDEETAEFLLLCAALDPRFKELPRLEPDQKDEVYANIQRRVLLLGDAPVKVKIEPDTDPQGIPSATPNVVRDLPEEENNNLPCEDMVTPSAGASACELCPTPAKIAKRSALEELLGDVYIVSATSGNKTTAQRIKTEIDNYKKQSSIPLTACPLMWWKTNEDQFPLMARRLLGIPSTSVASERVFSTAGDVVTATRSTLHPDNVDRLIFLKKNL